MIGDARPEWAGDGDGASFNQDAQWAMFGGV